MSVHLSTYLLLVFILGLSSCTDRSERIPAEKAEQLSRQAAEELHQSNYKNAERMFAESIELFSAAHANDRLADQYTSLATAQTLAGKLPAAMQSLASLRALYKQSADRNGELNTLLEMARINSQLGKTDDAVQLLEEVYLSSQLFQLKKQYAQSALQLGTLYADLGRHTKAVQYLSQSAAQFLQMADSALAVEAMIGTLSSYLQRGNRTAALQYLAQCENIVHTNTSTIDGAHVYALCGFALLHGKEWNFAAAAFRRSLALQHQSKNTNASRFFLPHLGVGEVFYKNFSFDAAQQSFIAAYKSAKSQSSALVQAYILIRIADCEMKKNSLIAAQERTIRATQLYENAQTLCLRAGYGFGEAVILHRFGLMKEASGDDISAITYYKRAFEKFMSTGFHPAHLHPLLKMEDLLAASDRSVERAVSEPLIALLLQYRKYSEAVDYAERANALELRAIAFKNDLQFKDVQKRKLYSDARSAHSASLISQRELFYFVKNSDNDYANQLQKRAQHAHTAFTAASSALSKAYAEFSFISQAQRIIEIQNSALPSAVTALRYYVAGNEAWVFVIRANEEITAVKLSSFGIALKKKMNRFTALLVTPKAAEYELKQLSNELYSILIQPVERYGSQRFLIIPAEEIEKFPFHALTKTGKPLIEMIEVSYLPSLYFVTAKKQLPQFITNVVAAGFAPDARWGLEFELRDVRSFFKNAQIFVNKNATKENLEVSAGEFLHIASRFHATPDGEYTLTLSDGTSSVVGTEIPAADFTSFTQFPFVYLADINTTSNSITRDHSLFWLVNGSQSIIVNELPITPKLSRAFNEGLYSTYSSTFYPYGAYRQAMIQLNKKKDFSEGLSFASYFYYGL